MFPYLRVLPSRLLVAAMAVVVLTGCEIPGIWPDPRIAQREEESKAIGGACRHALRGLEELYGVALDFDSTTPYANDECYGLRHSVYANGEIVDYTDNLPP